MDEGAVSWASEEMGVCRMQFYFWDSGTDMGLPHLRDFNFPVKAWTGH